MSGREVILARVRRALEDVPAGEPAGRGPSPGNGHGRAPEGGGEAAVELFARRCAEYRATVTRCPDTGEAIRQAVAAAAGRRRVASLVVPARLDEAWLPDELDVRRDDPALDLPELVDADAALTGCAAAIASTGTIVLDGGGDQGRRALTLVPDVHLCVVRAAQIVTGLAGAFERLSPAIGARRPITFISGPSATSDIELSRVEGVHGPRRLEVVLAG